VARCGGRAPQRRRSICFGRMPARTAESLRSASSARTGARSGGGADLRPRRACDRDPAAPARLQLARGGERRRERVRPGRPQLDRSRDPVELGPRRRTGLALSRPALHVGDRELGDGPFRSERGAFRIEIGNEGWSWPTGARAHGGRSRRTGPARHGVGRCAGRAVLAAHPPRRGCRAVAGPENRVDLDPDAKDVYGVPRPRRTTTPRPASPAREAHAAISRRRQ
jgi:hypothetical protein